MDEGFNIYPLLKGIAEKGKVNMKLHPGDFERDGIVICGKCGTPRQKFISIDDPMPGNPSHKSDLLVTVMCKCELEEEERQKREKQAAEDMAKIRKLRDASLMDEKFRSASFDSLIVTKHNERNLALCKRYAAKFDQMLQKNQGLIFWGDVGTGKSLAAACIANCLMDRGVPVMMTSIVELLKAIEKREMSESEILARMNSAQLVILDDLGAERSTDYALEKAYNIIDSRYRKQLPMILTTNLTMAEMKAEVDIRYTRIYDRVFESCYPMQFTGPSWRKKEASRRFEDMKRLLEDD